MADEQDKASQGGSAGDTAKAVKPAKPEQSRDDGSGDDGSARAWMSRMQANWQSFITTAGGVATAVVTYDLAKQIGEGDPGTNDQYWALGSVALFAIGAGMVLSIPLLLQANYRFPLIKAVATQRRRNIPRGWRKLVRPWVWTTKWSPWNWIGWLWPWNWKRRWQGRKRPEDPGNSTANGNPAFDEVTGTITVDDSSNDEWNQVIGRDVLLGHDDVVTFYDSLVGALIEVNQSLEDRVEVSAATSYKLDHYIPQRREVQYHVAAERIRYISKWAMALAIFGILFAVTGYANATYLTNHAQRAAAVNDIQTTHDHAKDLKTHDAALATPKPVSVLPATPASIKITLPNLGTAADVLQTTPEVLEPLGEVCWKNRDAFAFELSPSDRPDNQRFVRVVFTAVGACPTVTTRIQPAWIAAPAAAPPATPSSTPADGQGDGAATGG